LLVPPVETTEGLYGEVLLAGHGIIVRL
jgi:hypothetical protein